MWQPIISWFGRALLWMFAYWAIFTGLRLLGAIFAQDRSAAVKRAFAGFFSDNNVRSAYLSWAALITFLIALILLFAVPHRPFADGAVKSSVCSVDKETRTEASAVLDTAWCGDKCNDPHWNDKPADADDGETGPDDPDAGSDEVSANAEPSPTPAPTPAKKPEREYRDWFIDSLAIFLIITAAIYAPISRLDEFHAHMAANRKDREERKTNTSQAATTTVAPVTGWRRIFELEFLGNLAADGFIALLKVLASSLSGKKGVTP